MKNRKGFTLIELLAVIIILGLLMLIAIPSVTNYINNSRKEAYIDTAKQYIKGATALVNSGELDIYNTETTYYIPSTCINLETGGKSPYGGDFAPAYILVTYDNESFDYYWLSRDEQGIGVKTPTKSNDLKADVIEAGVKSSEVAATIGVDGRNSIIEFTQDCASQNEPVPATSNVSGDSGGSGGSSNDPFEQNSGSSLVTIDTGVQVYNGSGVNNYVQFNGELWRVVAIYNGQYKIMKASSIGQMNYNTNNVSDKRIWDTSSLQTYLNSTYYNSLSSAAKDMIDTHLWYVGNLGNTYNESQNDMTLAIAYESTQDRTWTGKVGLISAHEYLAASKGEGCATTSGRYNFFRTVCGKQSNDWLNLGTPYWIINGNYGIMNLEEIVRNDFLDAWRVDNTEAAVFPVVYLKSNITVTSGTGTSTDPYKLS